MSIAAADHIRRAPEAASAVRREFSKEEFAMRKSLAAILAVCAVTLAPVAAASAEPATSQPAPVRADSDLLRQLVRLLDTGSVTICPGQAMGSFGCSCPPGICL
ncbi:hypothetical protein ACWEO2_35255 [Nocardia sp. NPDC004278]